MPTKKLKTDNWILPKKDGTIARFTTYSDALRAKRERPLEFSREADIKFARSED